MRVRTLEPLVAAALLQGLTLAGCQLADQAAPQGGQESALRVNDSFQSFEDIRYDWALRMVGDPEATGRPFELGAWPGTFLTIEPDASNDALLVPSIVDRLREAQGANYTLPDDFFVEVHIDPEAATQTATRPALFVTGTNGATWTLQAGPIEDRPGGQLVQYRVRSIDCGGDTCVELSVRHSDDTRAYQGLSMPAGIGVADLTFGSLGSSIKMHRLTVFAGGEEACDSHPGDGARTGVLIAMSNEAQIPSTWDIQVDTDGTLNNSMTSLTLLGPRQIPEFIAEIARSTLPQAEIRQALLHGPDLERSLKEMEAQNLREVTLVLLGHGKFDDDGYAILDPFSDKPAPFAHTEDEPNLTDDELAALIAPFEARGMQVNLAVLTCNAGDLDTGLFRGEIFGASVSEGLLIAPQLGRWLWQTRSFPRCGRDWVSSWEAAGMEQKFWSRGAADRVPGQWLEIHGVREQLDPKERTTFRFDDFHYLKHEDRFIYFDESGTEVPREEPEEHADECPLLKTAPLEQQLKTSFCCDCVSGDLTEELVLVGDAASTGASTEVAAWSGESTDLQFPVAPLACSGDLAAPTALEPSVGSYLDALPEAFTVVAEYSHLSAECPMGWAFWGMWSWPVYACNAYTYDGVLGDDCPNLNSSAHVRLSGSDGRDYYVGIDGIDGVLEMKTLEGPLVVATETGAAVTAPALDGQTRYELRAVIRTSGDRVAVRLEHDGTVASEFVLPDGVGLLDVTVASIDAPARLHRVAVETAGGCY